MQTILLSHEEVAQIAQKLYKNKIEAQVNIKENIGKMVIIDIQTENYEVDKTGLEAVKHLTKKNPNCRLFGIKIGYNVAASFGGIIEY